jgi:ABC-type lipoprotein release transport system permease subunit
LLFDTPNNDVVTFAIVGSVFMLVALFASYIPARRATQVDPLVALRTE